MEQADLNSSHTTSPGRVRAGRPLRLLIAVVLAMVVIWLGVVLSRHAIRAHYWAYRLRSAASGGERLVYFQLLADLHDGAVSAVLPLLDEDDPGLRSLAVGVLHHARNNSALEGLIRATRDDDRDVRRLAIAGLAIRDDQPGARELDRLLRNSDQREAMTVAAALSAVPSRAARDVLIDAVLTNPYPGVRVEAILSLESLRAVEAVPALIEALADEAVFLGVTEADIYAADVFYAVEDKLTAEHVLASELRLDVPASRVVGVAAERALEVITGRSMDEPPDPRRARSQIAESWRAWWVGTEKEQTGVEPD